MTTQNHLPFPIGTIHFIGIIALFAFAILVDVLQLF